MTANITLVDGTKLTVECKSFNTWHGNEITLWVTRDELPQICYKFPNSLVQRCEIRGNDGALSYRNEAVNDKYINGYTNEKGQHVTVTVELWKPEKIQEYLRNAEKFGVQINRNKEKNLFSNNHPTESYRFREAFGYRRGENLDPVAPCVKICRVCKLFFRTEAHAQKTCDDCKSKEAQRNEH